MPLFLLSLQEGLGEVTHVTKVPSCVLPLVWLEKSPLLAWGGLRVHAPVSLFLNDILKQLPILSILVFTLTPIGDIEFGIIVS